jgi:hypothetical protein
MAVFKNIVHTEMLKETMRWFATNKDGNPSKLYKYLFAVVFVLQTFFQSFSAWRDEKFIIANCKWQMGQLTNVLNYFFDPINKTIYIDQAIILNIFDPVITGNQAVNFDPVITGNESTLYEPDFYSTVYITGVIVHVPNAIYIDSIQMSALTAVLEQIKITGLSYTIVSL